MTEREFYQACVQRTIDPALALENDAVREALAAKDTARVIHLLETEF